MIAVMSVSRQTDKQTEVQTERETDNKLSQLVRQKVILNDTAIFLKNHNLSMVTDS